MECAITDDSTLRPVALAPLLSCTQSNIIYAAENLLAVRTRIVRSRL